MNQVQEVENTPKGYLIFDHNGVLETMRESHLCDPQFDLILQENDWGCHQILPGGVEFMPLLNELVNAGYKLVFGSSNKKAEQDELVAQLRAACERQGLQMPPIYATVVLDKDVYEGFDRHNPSVAHDKDGTIIVGTSDDSLGGKAHLQEALINGLGMSDPQRQQSIFFDDGEPNALNGLKYYGHAFRVGEKLDGVPYGTLLNGLKSFAKQVMADVTAPAKDEQQPRDARPADEEFAKNQREFLPVSFFMVMSNPYVKFTSVALLGLGLAMFTIGGFAAAGVLAPTALATGLFFAVAGTLTACGLFGVISASMGGKASSVEDRDIEAPLLK